MRGGTSRRLGYRLRGESFKEFVKMGSVNLPLLVQEASLMSAKETRSFCVCVDLNESSHSVQ